MALVKAGELIGFAQNVVEKHGAPMLNHVHFQLALKPYGAIIKGGEWNTKLIYINPLHFIDIGV
jgi:hypothetical protein